MGYWRIKANMHKRRQIRSVGGNSRCSKFNWAELYLDYTKKLGHKHLGNEDAVSTLAALCASHVLRLRHDPLEVVAPRCLIIGGTGSGKSQLVELAMGLLENIPRIYINASVLAPIAYKGVDLSDCFQSILSSAKADRQNCIHNTAVSLEEFDKLVLRGKGDDFCRSLQLSFLPLLGGEKILVSPSGEAVGKHRYINSTSSLVFATGVFQGIPRAALKTPETARRALVKFGFSREIVGRFTHFITLDKMAPNQMLNRLRSEIEAVMPLYDLNYGVSAFTDIQLRKIIQKHKVGEFGFRSLRNDVHQLLFEKAKARAKMSQLGQRV